MTTELQETWKTLFQKTLPSAARDHSPAQPHWPVHVDHCFARIILDKVVGGGSEPWIGKLKTPAYKNMSEEQLEAAIKLGEDILEGKADLVELDRSSLVSRGKAIKKGTVVDKRKREDSGKVAARKREKIDKEDNESEEHDIKYEEDDSETDKPKTDDKPKEGLEDEDHQAENQEVDAESNKKQSPSEDAQNESISKYFTKQDKKQGENSISANNAQEQERLLQKITNSNKTSFQKQVLGLLLQIPPGRYSTYGHLSQHLNSSPRAVGNALRNNPFAPDVPCHRVLATGGGIGGFGGSWGKGGKAGENDHEKKRLLNEEGVRFDGKGKAVGEPFIKFHQTSMIPN